MTQLTDFEVEIGGVSVKSYVLDYDVVDTFDDMSPGTVILSPSSLSSVNVSERQPVVITEYYDDGTSKIIMNGVVSNTQKDRGLQIVIDCNDNLYTFTRKTLIKTYEINVDPQAGVISAIAQDIIETYGGGTAIVESTGTTNVLEKFVIRGDTLYDALKELASYVDYIVRYDSNNDVYYFVSKSYLQSSNPTALQVGVNIVDLPKWNYEYDKIINDITLVGVDKEFETTENFTATSSQTEFVLAFKPISIKVFVDGVLQEGGIDPTTENFDYSVDSESKIVTFENALSGGEDVEVEYSYLLPIKVRQKNPTSIESYGLSSLQKKEDTIITIADAESKASEVLQKFSDPPVSFENLPVAIVVDLEAGNQVNIIDEQNGENRTVTIRRVKHTLTNPFKIIDVDDYPVFEFYVQQNAVRRRIERLERRLQNNDDLLINIFETNRDFVFERRYSELIKEEIVDNTILIWDHPLQGQWDNFNWGGNAFGNTTTAKRVQGRNTYEELVYDTDFYDSANSTATWTTGTNTISFTSGQVLITEALDIGTTFSQAQIDLGDTTGDVLIEISSDNKNTWQTLTEGELTSLTSSDGTGTYLRITENNTSTASITNSQGLFGQVTHPAIKLRMVI